jgi:hypothetical protein
VCCGVCATKRRSDPTVDSSRTIWIFFFSFSNKKRIEVSSRDRILIIRGEDQQNLWVTHEISREPLRGRGPRFLSKFSIAF